MLPVIPPNLSAELFTSALVAMLNPLAHTILLPPWQSLMSRHRGAWLDLLTRHADAELEGIASGRRATMTKIAKLCTLLFVLSESGMDHVAHCRGVVGAHIHRMISQFREDNEAAFIEEWTAFLVQEDEDLLRLFVRLCGSHHWRVFVCKFTCV